MQTYYANLNAIQQKTMQLDNEQCIHCGQAEQLVSHGFIYKKQAVATMPKPVGKRALCSKRYGRTGCGRTMGLYLDSMVRYLHTAGNSVVAFVFLLMEGVTIGDAYQQITGTADARHAYRWLNKLFTRLAHYRSLLHHTNFDELTHTNGNVFSLRRRLLASTFTVLLQRFSEPLCSSYQRTLQISFL